MSLPTSYISCTGCDYYCSVMNGYDRFEFRDDSVSVDSGIPDVSISWCYRCDALRYIFTGKPKYHNRVILRLDQLEQLKYKQRKVQKYVLLPFRIYYEIKIYFSKKKLQKELLDSNYEYQMQYWEELGAQRRCLTCKTFDGEKSNLEYSSSNIGLKVLKHKCGGDFILKSSNIWDRWIPNIIFYDKFGIVTSDNQPKGIV